MPMDPRRRNESGEAVEQLGNAAIARTIITLGTASASKPSPKP